MTRFLLPLLALALVGCAQNAVLELTIQLPPDSAGGPHFAYVQARANVTNFDDTWAGTGELAAFPLTAMAQTVQVSVVTSDGAIVADPLAIKISFCGSSTCTALADAMAPQARFLVARAFYIGHRTSLTLSIPTFPTSATPAPTMIGKCEVAGCRDGTTADYCTMMGTRHFCEQ